MKRNHSALVLPRMSQAVFFCTLLPLFSNLSCVSGQAPPTGMVRLVNSGSSNREGRVEVYLYGEWGTVCDDAWDTLDAQVVCRQLGFDPNQAVAYHGGHFQNGVDSQSIWLDEVGCQGYESRLTDCYVPYGFGDHDCQHTEDAGVLCGMSGVEEVRLAGGLHAWEGRVEVRVSGVWGTVCDDGWDQEDAAVVCRQLGFDSSQATAYLSAHFGDGSGTIQLANVQCDGTESSLGNCPANTVGHHDCSHSQDAGVSCHSLLVYPTTTGYGDDQLNNEETNTIIYICAAVVVPIIFICIVTIVIVKCSRKKRARRQPRAAHAVYPTNQYMYPRPVPVPVNGSAWLYPPPVAHPPSMVQSPQTVAFHSGGNGVVMHL